MFSHKQQPALTGRSIAMAGIAALAFAAAEPPQAFAHASEPFVKQAAAGQASTDLSARRRYRRVYRSNPAAGLAIMGAMIGTFGAIAAQRDYDDYYYGPHYYYGPPPVYYAPHPYYYGPRYYRYYPY